MLHIAPLHLIIDHQKWIIQLLMLSYYEFKEDKMIERDATAVKHSHNILLKSRLNLLIPLWHYNQSTKDLKTLSKLSSHNEWKEINKKKSVE